MTSTGLELMQNVCLRIHCQCVRTFSLCTFILVLDCVSNVGKLAIFKDEESVLLSQRLQFLAEGHCEVLSAEKQQSEIDGLDHVPTAPPPPPPPQ